MVALAGNGWKLAPCLAQMVEEADALAPERVTLADGTIGDQAHTERTSHHNPKDGWVDGLDLTHSPQYGWDCEDRVHQILGDPRVEYVIYARRIWRGYDKPGLPKWTAQPYTGPNTHQHHMHVSVWRDNRRMDTAPWFTPPATEDDDMHDTLIEIAYREASRDPDKDPKGVGFWVKKLIATPPPDRLKVVNECRSLLGLKAI